MEKYIRIGGDIISSPLNENFRKLSQSIDMTNTNFFFSEEHSTVPNVQALYDLTPQNGQVCYVESSGQLMRYNSSTRTWICIADFGQTFRQGFMNTGVILMNGVVKVKEGSLTTLEIPDLLVYFKNKPGSDAYGTGVYKFQAQEYEIGNLAYGTYSLFIDEDGIIIQQDHTPSNDNPSTIYLCTFLVNKDGEVLKDFINTMPDVPYTTDRGIFYAHGGECVGMTLSAGENAKVNRSSGYYYDEGVSYLMGPSTDYPEASLNYSNYNIAVSNEAENCVLYYITPGEGLNISGQLESETDMICNKYWNGSELANVTNNYYTIQHHLITPVATVVNDALVVEMKNIIVYGDKQYDSLQDARVDLNREFTIDSDFLYAEASRIIVKNTSDFSTQEDCEFYTLSKLAQVGGISPSFEDDEFEIYRNGGNSKLRINLDLLENSGAANYTLYPQGKAYTRYYFALDNKYNTQDVDPTPVTKQESATRTEYNIADNTDVIDVRNRVNDIEKEIWKSSGDAEDAKYGFGIRYRLNELENTESEHDASITDLITNKVDKITTVNNKALSQNITLYTDDINEKVQNPQHLWYDATEKGKVADATEHINEISSLTDEPHIVVNPHSLTTDDIYLRNNTDKQFVTSGDKDNLANFPSVYYAKNYSTYEGYADKSVESTAIIGMSIAGVNKYYGTNLEGQAGIFTLPIGVRSDEAESYVNIDDIILTIPNKSVTVAKLEDTLAATIANNYHTIEESGVLKSSEINSFNFGNGFSVSVSDNKATITCTGGGGTGGSTTFTGLLDTPNSYTGFGGKALFVNENETGLEFSDLDLTNIMEKDIYVDTTDNTKVKKAVYADSSNIANVATSAQSSLTASTANNALALQDKTIDDSKETEDYLWTAEKIISYTEDVVDRDGIKTYYGTVAPSILDIYKEGDLYILIQED